MRKTKLLSLILALVLIFSLTACTGGQGGNGGDKNPPQPTPDVGYGLQDNIQDGVILHCFNWRYTDITNELEKIAKAGFTAVQTSPAQAPTGTGSWYWLYQPKDLAASQNPLGTVDQLKDLCEAADEYGIKVIVDVVANHLSGSSYQIPQDLKADEFWHNQGSVSNWQDRRQVTLGNVGMPDLNTENDYVQQKVNAYVQFLKGLGVDGIRWDAAKHIGLPSEGSDFWPSVIDTEMYNYGEILYAPDDRSSGNEGLMKEYTNYMSVTDSAYGSLLRNAFAFGYAPTAYANWAARGVANDKLVYWAESHDSFSNGQEGDYSSATSQNNIDRAYAIAAARDGATALYFSRPITHIKEHILMGQKGSTHFAVSEVAEINKFHNAMAGQKEYFTTGQNCAVVSRQTGAVIVAGSGANFTVTVPNGGGLTRPGTYVDQISGEKWVVTSTTMTGKIGESGIVAIYDPKNTTPPDDSVDVPEQETPVTGDYVIYYKNTSGFLAPYAYFWATNNTSLTSWPGEPMTNIGGGVYKIIVPKEAGFIIFSDQGSKQTADLFIPGSNMIYDGNWSAYDG